jgi:hypothetical protein
VGDNLKYMASGKQTIYPADYPTKVDFMRRSQKWLEDKMAEGVVESAYSYLAGGGFFIFNVPSHEEFVSQLIDFPLYPLCEFEVNPIIDFNKNNDLVIEEFKKIGVYKDE